MSSDAGLGRGGGISSNQESLRKPSNIRSIGLCGIDGLVNQTQQLNLHNNQLAKGDSVSSKSLNPYATEFIPSFGIGINRLVESNPIETNGEPDSDVLYPESNSSSKKGDVDADFYALSELKEFIDNISSQPADYESHVPYITDVLNKWIAEDPDFLMVCVVNTIVDQTIIDPNFRYNGVRLCIHLVDHLKIFASQGKFEDVLLQRCQREYSRRDELARATDGGVHLRGLTLFIGDLSTHFTDTELIRLVPQLINTLLLRPTTENIKCACMTLKLCGTYLDGNEEKKNVDQIIRQLEGFLSNPNSSSRELIRNVIELRTNGWNSLVRQNTHIQHNPYAAGDTGYPYDNKFYVDDVIYDFGGDENEPDVCSAFDEFLRASGQMN